LNVSPKKERRPSVGVAFLFWRRKLSGNNQVEPQVVVVLLGHSVAVGAAGHPPPLQGDEEGVL